MSALVLTPGASATKDQPSLVAVDKAVTQLGVDVRRIDLPKTANKAVVAVREYAAGLGAETVFLGGRSFGGRVCSMAVSEGTAAAGLVLISYPLHPPGKREQLRTAHFPLLDVPCLFVSGTRDAFGAPDELESATKAIPGEVTHVWIDGGNHGLRGKDQAVADAVVGWLERRLPDALS